MALSRAGKERKAASLASLNSVFLVAAFRKIQKDGGRRFRMRWAIKKVREKKKTTGCGTNQRRRGKKKKEERRAETWHSGTQASSKLLLGLKPCQPEGCGMVPIPAFINASYTRSLIYNRLTADILQVPLGTSEDRRNLREIRCPGSSLKVESPPVQSNNLVAFFFYSVCWGLGSMCSRHRASREWRLLGQSEDVGHMTGV